MLILVIYSAFSSYAVAVLAVYALLTNPLLLIAIGFLAGGFAAISKFAAEPAQPGDPAPPVTQKSLYTGLFVIGIPLMWFAAPLSTVFWIVGASSVLVLGHASMLEPGVVSQHHSRYALLHLRSSVCRSLNSTL